MQYKKDVSLSYLNHLQTAWYANELIDTQQVYALFNKFKHVSTALYNSLPLFFIIDYTARSYLLMTDELLNVTGYHPGDFLEAGLAILLDVFHKDDFSVFNSKLFVRNADFLKSVPQNQHVDHLFTYNFRVTRKDKQVSHVLQKGTYITSSKTGLPLYSLGTITDITDFKTDTAIVHTIEKFSGGQQRQLVERNFYYPHPEDAQLSQRERDVLGYMAEGYSSKQIADKLNISEKTVFNHRQNMLRKTNTKNVAELIACGIRKRII